MSTVPGGSSFRSVADMWHHRPIKAVANGEPSYENTAVTGRAVTPLVDAGGIVPLSIRLVSAATVFGRGGAGLGG